MTASSFGIKNQPKFADADAPDVAVNPSQAAEYAAKVGNRRVGTTAERDAATGKDVWEGLKWGDTTDGFDYKRVGEAWARESTVFAQAAGQASNATGAFKAVTFPAGRFSVAPLVTMTMTGNVAGIGITQAVTASGFNGGGFNDAGSAVASTWVWHAIQMTPTSAGG